MSRHRPYSAVAQVHFVHNSANLRRVTARRDTLVGGFVFTIQESAKLLWKTIKTGPAKELMHSSVSGMEFVDTQWRDRFRELAGVKCPISLVTVSCHADIVRYRRLIDGDAVSAKHSIDGFSRFFGLILGAVYYAIPGIRPRDLRQIISDIGGSHRKNINITYARFVIAFCLYRALLRVLDIRGVFLVSSYTKHHLVAASKSLGIPTVEIQHGFISSSHPGYHLPPILLRRPVAFPDKLIATFSSNWADYPNISMVTHGGAHVEIRQESLTRSSTQDRVVVTGQGIATEKLTRFVVEFSMLLAKVLPHLKVNYRPHPTESAASIREAQTVLSDSPNVEIDGGYRPIRNLLSRAVAHASIYSSVHSEAVEVIGWTCVLDIDPSAKRYWSDMIKTQPNHYVLVRTPQDLISAIEARKK